MIDRTRARLVVHGGVILLVGLTSGFAAVLDQPGEAARGWTSVHQTLLMVGTWILATAGIHPVLVLPRREATALVWSLLGAGYALVVTLIIRAATGVRGFSPEGPLANQVAFGTNMVAVLGAFLAVMLTAVGARAGLQASLPSGDSRPTDRR